MACRNKSGQTITHVTDQPLLIGAVHRRVYRNHARPASGSPACRRRRHEVRGMRGRLEQWEIEGRDKLQISGVFTTLWIPCVCTDHGCANKSGTYVVALEGVVLSYRTIRIDNDNAELSGSCAFLRSTTAHDEFQHIVKQANANWLRVGQIHVQKHTEPQAPYSVEWKDAFPWGKCEWSPSR